MRAQPVADDAPAAAEIAELRIVAVYNYRAVRRQEVYHLGLGSENAVEIVQKLKMRMTYPSEHRDGRARHGGEHAHLPKAGDAHLHHGRLVRGRQARERHGHAYLIVEVALGLEGVHAPAEHRPDHLLGGRLADAAGDADDGDVEFFAVGAHNGFQRGLHIVHNDNAAPLALRRTLGKAARRAPVERRGDIVVPVRPLAAVGDEHVARADLAQRRRERTFAAKRSAAGAQRILDREIIHIASTPTINTIEF